MKRMIHIMILLFTISMFTSCGTHKEEKDLNTIYRIGFEKYISEKLNLGMYEEMLASSDMKYIPKDVETQREAQKASTLDFAYIYIRNEMHTERLTKEQQDMLATQNPEEPYSDDIRQLIEETYENVASSMEITSEADKKVETYYDEGLHPSLVPVNAIVIRVSTMPEYDANGNYVNKEHEYEKDDALAMFVSVMQEDVSGKLGDLPVVVEME